jgi:hypothetical protein
MLRTATSIVPATIVALATLGLSGRALADDALGDDAVEPVEPPGCECVGDTALLDQDGSQLETPDPHAPVDIIVAPSPYRVPRPVFSCGGEGDPRCREDQQGEAPHVRSLGGAVGTTLAPTAPRIERARVTRIRFDHERTRGAAGVRSALERPPRR